MRDEGISREKDINLFSLLPFPLSLKMCTILFEDEETPTYVGGLILQIPIGEIFLGVFNHFVKELLSVVNSAGNEGIVGEYAEDCVQIAVCDSGVKSLLLIAVSGNERIDLLGNVSCEYGVKAIRTENCVGLNNCSDRQVGYLTAVVDVYVGNEGLKS